LSETRHLARIEDYDGLIGALCARANELNVSRETIGDLSGLASGYVGKLLGPRSIRRIGMQSLGPLLGALGVRLVMVEDSAALRKIRPRLTKRDEAQVRNGPRKR
jgi:hypothetical protein